MAKNKRQRYKLGTVGPAEAARPYFREWTVDELKKLLIDLTPYAKDMPTELWNRVRWLIAGLILKQGISMEDIHTIRWEAVCESIERVGWDEAFEDASKRLADTPAAGGPDVMETDYKLMQRTLPPELRRKRQRL